MVRLAPFMGWGHSELWHITPSQTGEVPAVGGTMSLVDGSSFSDDDMTFVGIQCRDPTPFMYRWSLSCSLCWIRRRHRRGDDTAL